MNKIQTKADEPDNYSLFPKSRDSILWRLWVGLGVRVTVLVIAVLFLAPLMTWPVMYATNSEDASGSLGIAAVHETYQSFVSDCMANLDTASSRLLYEQQLLGFTSSDLRVVWVGFVLLSSDQCVVNSNGPSITNPTGQIVTFNSTLAVDNLKVLSFSWEPQRACGNSLQSAEGVLLSACSSASHLSIVSSSQVGSNFYFVAMIDSEQYGLAGGIWWLCRVLALVALIVTGTLFLIQEPYNLVLKPLYGTLELVESIRKNPLKATVMDDSQEQSMASELLFLEKRLCLAKTCLSRWYWNRRLCQFRESCSTEPLAIEQIIVRIGGLLALGFGPGGVDILSKNLSSQGGSLDLVKTGGKRVGAIFATIMISDFQTLNSVLGDKIIFFINQVCDIVYGIADEYHGFATANRTSDGESFLLIWKYDNMDASSPRKSSRSPTSTQLHDMAVAACVKIQIAISRSPELREYSKFPPLIQKLKKFRVKLATGLHSGWATEGVVGTSTLKIDPIYISPDVNIAETIGGLGESIYQVDGIVATGDFLNNCSENVLGLFRQIDAVVLGGPRSIGGERSANALPIDIAVFEIDPGEGIATFERTQTYHKSRLYRRDQRELRKQSKLHANIYASLINDPDFGLLIGKFRDELSAAKFKDGFLNYQSGQWQVARNQLIELTGHGPSNFLLNFMGRNNFIAPPDWKGFRTIDE